MLWPRLERAEVHARARHDALGALLVRHVLALHLESARRDRTGAIDDRRAPQPVADAVSALVNLGYGQPQAAAAVAAASRNAGEGADAARLIRLGLKELSK